MDDIFEWLNKFDTGKRKLFVLTFALNDRYYIEGPGDKYEISITFCQHLLRQGWRRNVAITKNQVLQRIEKALEEEPAGGWT